MFVLAKTACFFFTNHVRVISNEGWFHTCIYLKYMYVRTYLKYMIVHKYVRQLNDKNIDFKIKWNIIARSRPYSSGKRYCNLCLTEKYFIATSKEPNILNKKSEIISKCRHRRKHLLSTLKTWPRTVIPSKFLSPLNFNFWFCSPWYICWNSFSFIYVWWSVAQSQSVKL